MDQSTHNVRRANWLNIINQCQNRPSDVSAKQWLADNGIKEKAYYYWLRKFRKEAYGQMQVSAPARSAEVSFAEFSIPMDSPFGPMADRHTLEELNNCSREELITIVLT